MRTSARAAIVLPALLAGLGCSRLPPPAEFPPLDTVAADAVRATLNERATSIRSLYAEVTAIYRGPDLDGTIDLVVHYRAPDHVRISAFKDVVLSVETLFDLVLTPDGWRVAISAEQGRAPTVTTGTGGFPEAFPDFAEFHWAREAFGCPGRTRGDARVLRDGSGSLFVDGVLTSGARVRWRADEDTLRITAARVWPPAGPELLLDYSDWRAVGGHFVPGRVVLRANAGAASKRIDARLDYVLVDLAIEPDVFALAP